MRRPGECRRLDVKKVEYLPEGILTTKKVDS